MKQVAMLFLVLALLALPAMACAETSAPTGESASAMKQIGGPSVTIIDFAFQPAFVSVAAGSTVTWLNDGGSPHTVTSDNGAFDSNMLSPGGRFSEPFWTPGTYSYHCAIHPSMTGTVQVA